MNNLLPHTSFMVQSLGIALLHSIGQCLLIYICLQLVLALTGKQNAKARYSISMGAMVLMFAWFIDTWAEQWARLRDTVVTIMEGNAAPVTINASIGTSATAGYGGDLLNGLMAEVQPYLPIAVGIYLAGLAFMLLRFGAGIYQVHRMRTKGITMLANDWMQWLQDKKEQLQISRPLQLCYSVYVKVPMTIGTLKPVILLPFTMANSLSTEQVEAILLHELAHIKRNDYLLNILQAVIETILFFNPFVWLVSSIIRREREHSCDDLVLSCTEGPLSYAKALATLEAFRKEANSMALAATGNKNRLFHRIKRIMEMKKEKNNYTRSIIATLVIVAIAISFIWFSPSFAQSHKTKTSTQQKHSTGTTQSKTSKTYEPAKAPRPPKAPVVAEEADAPGAPEAAEVPEAAEAPEPPDTDETVSKAMSEVDWDKIGKEMDQAGREMDQASREIAAVDWSSLDRELAQAKKELDAVNWEEVQNEIDNSLKEARRSIDDPKVRKQVEQSLELARRQSEKAIAQANRALAEAELNAKRRQKAHSYNLAISAGGAGNGGAYVYSKGNGRGYSYAYGKSNTSAHAGGMHEVMLHKMENEGLINRSKSYKIEKYDDRLYINGQLQPRDVYQRYNKYMKNENLTIKGDRDHIRISVKD